MRRDNLPKLSCKELKEFVEYLINERGFSNLTALSYNDDCELFLGFLKVNGINYHKVDVEKIRGYMFDLLNSGMSKASLKQHLAALKHFYSFMYSRKYIEHDPFEFVNSPKSDQRLPDFLSDVEIKQLLDANAQRKDDLAIRDQAILELMLASGLRASEVCSLRLNNVNLRNRTVRIIGKGNKERYVYYGSKCAELLDKYLELDHRESPYLLIGKKSDRLNEREIRSIVTDTAKKAGIEVHVSPHTLRHTYATHMLNDGADLKSVGDLLGHESLSTTQIYTHVSNERLRQVYLSAHPRAHKN